MRQSYGCNDEAMVLDGYVTLGMKLMITYMIMLCWFVYDLGALCLVIVHGLIMRSSCTCLGTFCAVFGLAVTTGTRTFISLDLNFGLTVKTSESCTDLLFVLLVNNRYLGKFSDTT